MIATVILLLDYIFFLSVATKAYFLVEQILKDVFRILN